MTKPSRQKNKQKADSLKPTSKSPDKNGLSSTLGMHTLSLHNQDGKIIVGLNGNGTSNSNKHDPPDHLLDLSRNSGSYSDEGYNMMTSTLLESCEETEDVDIDNLIPKIVKVVSLAPTAEQEEFDDDKDDENQRPVNGKL